MARLQIVLPCPPNRANQSRGFAQYEGFYKKRYFRKCAGALMELKTNARKAGVSLPSWKVTWLAEFEVASKYDADNLAALCKWPMDALKQGGIIVDDGPDFAWPIGWPTQVVTGRKKRNRNMLLILEVL